MKKLLLLSILILTSACVKTANDQPATFQVFNGDNMRTVSRRLQTDGIIKNESIFRLAARWQKSVLKRGNYEIPAQVSYFELLGILASGKSISVRVTIPEGLTSFEIAKILEESNVCFSNQFIAEISKPEYLARYNIPKNAAQSLEGYLFPDTYHFTPDTPPSTVVGAMLTRFEQVALPLVSGAGNLHRILTLAAIVEKETGGNSEMPRVAGVYLRRMRIGMKLQADPTLIYALILDGEYTGNIRTKHLRPPYPHAYNTYYANGLPPGPVASPGKDAIAAVLAPEDTSYLYFVGRGDGTHQFSKTLVEHNAAVKKYQLGQ